MPLERTVEWFKVGRPFVDTKHFYSQIGCHFEEVVEMLDQLDGHNDLTLDLLHHAKANLSALAEAIKAQQCSISILDRVAFLDAITDQLVTATGVAHVAEMDVVEALREVNRSNWSKFVDGKPVYNADGKIIKGPEYSEPDLKEYI